MLSAGYKGRKGGKGRVYALKAGTKKGEEFSHLGWHENSCGRRSVQCKFSQEIDKKYHGLDFLSAQTTLRKRKYSGFSKNSTEEVEKEDAKLNM